VTDTPPYAMGLCSHCGCEMVIYYPQVEAIVSSILMHPAREPECPERAYDMPHIFEQETVVYPPDDGCMVIWQEKIE